MPIPSFDASNPLLGYGAFLYIFFWLVTFSWQYRYRIAHGEGPIGVLKSLCWSTMWPLYWLFVHGVTGVYQIVVELILLLIAGIEAISIAAIRSARKVYEELHLTTDNIFDAYFIIGIFFMIPYQLAVRSDTCSGLANCSGELLKSLLWSLLWPVYILARILGT